MNPDRIDLIITDDHALIREGLRRLLADEADLNVVGEAESGTALMQLLEGVIPDVVLLDIAMPGKSGIGLMSELRARYPELAVLVLSMHGEQQYAARMLRAGACGYLTKSAGREQLLNAIRSVAGGGIYLRPELRDRIEREMLHPARSHTHHSLSEREYQVLLALAGGQSVTEIARDLSLSIKTVSTHKAHLMEKMGFSNLAGLMQYALDHHLLGDGT